MKDQPNGEKSARMIDVARLAGVSQQTVSRVINDHPSVSPEARDRVESAIRRLRYRRHPSARVLASNRSLTIGVISFGLAQYGPSVILTGIVDEAKRAGYSTSLVAIADAQRDMRSAVDHLRAVPVDGVIVVAPIEAALASARSLDIAVPLVVFEPGAHHLADNVVTDEVSGSAAATRYLLELGHNTVHHVSGPAGWLGTTARIAGWTRSLVEAGVVPHPAVEGDWTTSSGYRAGLLVADTPGVTAVFVANDQMALGVIKALTERGLEVPGDVSVIGFDDVPESSFFRPALSTMRIDFDRVGRHAVARLIALISGRPDTSDRAVAPELLERQSTGPPKHQRHRQTTPLTATKEHPMTANSQTTLTTRKLGSTPFVVSSVCVGTSALGSFPEQYGYEVSAQSAVATIRRVFEGPFTFIDTSNEYGKGESERRIGQAIRDAGGVPEGFLVATKVDPLPGSTDFSGDRVKRSVDESLERLGLDTLPLVYLHDPEKITFEEATAKGGPVEALVSLKEQGIIQHLGVAGGPIDLELRYLATDVYDAVISHNRYTLVEQTAEPLLEDAARRGVAFINAAPFGGGMLVKGPTAVPRYCYAPVGEATLARVREMERLCAEAGVPLAAAALQFSLRDERVTSTIVGMSEPGRVEQTVALAEVDIPDELWSQLLPLASVGRHGIEEFAS